MCQAPLISKRFTAIALSDCPCCRTTIPGAGGPLRYILLLTILTVSLEWIAVAPSACAADKDDPAADLVLQALQAEAAGQLADRTRLLQQALVESPDYAPAHWHLGQFKAGSTWMTAENMAEASLNNEALKRYLEMRRDCLQAAHWIWLPLQTDKQSCHLRKTFTLTGKALRADLRVAARGYYEVHVNGKRIGGGRPGTGPVQYRVAAALRAGTNSVAVEVSPPGQAGVLVWMEGHLKDKSVFVVASDATWKASTQDVKKWQATDFQDDDWQSVPVLDPPAVPAGAQKPSTPNPNEPVLPSISVDLEQALAEWCEDQALEPQARFHWSRVLLASPTHSAAMKALGLKPFGNELLTQQQIDERVAEEVALKKATARWGDTLKSIRDQLATPRPEKIIAGARKRIEEITDPDAIPLFRSLLVNNTPKPNVPFAKACISALGSMDKPSASVAIVEAVYYHPDPEVAAEAAKSLSNLDLVAFVPVVMGHFKATSQFTFRIDESSETKEEEVKEVTKRVDKNGKEEKEEKTRKEKVTYWTYRARTRRTTPGPENELEETRDIERTTKDSGRRSTLQALEVELVRMKAETDAHNVAVEWHNRGLSTLLEAVTGKKLGPAPQPWWDWWKEHNELQYSASSARTSTWWDQVRGSQQHLKSSGPPRECFGRGTPVWTRRGMVPIETILEGDDILSQSPQTGELAYKVVLSVATRPPTPLNQVVIGRDSIVMTKGHRLWVSGKGWRMSKQIAQGDPIHSLNGPLPVESTSDIADQPTYNLVVEDFHSFFVGRERILVHDAGAPEPTDCVVPGLPRSALPK